MLIKKLLMQVLLGAATTVGAILTKKAFTKMDDPAFKAKRKKFYKSVTHKFIIKKRSPNEDSSF